ncbi:MAG TPA: MBL fold metallo-hydrolase [Casimicrobiaceae bacterium]|nr:MBL fold metallo-hydrolase [Casimicrobiaceae bacterium]
MRTTVRLVVTLGLLATCAGAGAQNVKVTPLGTHPGELCSRDRATLFEDPSGVRILYDAGQSVLGGDDARLGSVHAVLLSHAHGDHIGDQRLKAIGAGTCEASQVTSAAPSSTTAEIVASKNAAIVMIVPLANFIGTKVAAIKGKPTAACAQTGNDIVVPPSAPCLATVQTGGTRALRTTEAKQAVEIIAVPAVHDSTVPRELLGAEARKALDTDNVSVQLGPPSGYVIRFTNGLVLYLSGDTGMHAEMRSVVHDYYHANLMQLNLGSSAVSSTDAAYIVNELVQPASVIASHVNEAATADGKLRPASRTAAFVALVKGRPVHPALSGKTMEFNGEGKCVAGC